jgi:3-oxosteroid 1-dehydrogenase
MTEYDEAVDFVIVGSGAGSMVAALYLRSHGLQVLLLEKTELVGGSTARSGGIMWIPNNPFMARDGVEDSYEKALTYLEAVSANQDDAPAATPERRRRFLEEGPRMLEFLLSQGIDLDRSSYWPDYYDEYPGGSAPGRTVYARPFNIKELGKWQHRIRPSFISLPGDLPATIEEMRKLSLFKRSWGGRLMMLRVVLRGIWGKLTGKRYVSGGAALQGRMLQAALRAGVDVRLGSPVRELIVEQGAVTGVVTVCAGEPWRVTSRRGVLVNAGGFGRNQAMRERYQPGTSANWSLASPGDTGEMIEEMLAKGAAPAQLEEFVGYQATLPPGSEQEEFKPGAQGMTAAPHAILVDRTGVRYMNEGGSYMAYCKAMLERDKTVPAVPSWAIFDSQYMAKYMLAGTMPGSTRPREWYDKGYLRKADSLGELARLIEVDPQVLESTVSRFNGFVVHNRDEDFGRGERAYDNWLGDPLHEPSQTLGSIEKPPFYAVPVVPGDVGTYGGVLTDDQARVLRGDGTPIPGLYATGVCTGSVMGRVYPGAGCSIGPAFTWGFVAARHAAGD